MKNLSIGISPCPNDVFIFAGMILGEVTLDGYSLSVDYQDVETLNHNTEQGQYDIAKISYANLPYVSNRYTLLDSGGALGRGVGPLLLTGGAKFDPECEILVPGERTTANFLLGFYLDRPIKRRYLPFDEVYAVMLQNREAQGVVIHEKRFTYAQDGLHLVTDLGDHWEKKTGCPIPLGGIVLKKSLEIDPTLLEEKIRESIRWAEAHDAETFALCREYAQDMDENVIRAHIGLYVNEFSLSLGEEGQRAVSILRERMAALQSFT